MAKRAVYRHSSTGRFASRQAWKASKARGNGIYREYIEVMGYGEWKARDGGNEIDDIDDIMRYEDYEDYEHEFHGTGDTGRRKK